MWLTTIWEFYKLTGKTGDQNTTKFYSYIRAEILGSQAGSSVTPFPKTGTVELGTIVAR